MAGFKGSKYVPERGTEESKAITELKSLKVYEVMNDDACAYSSFDDVWFAVAHETDIFEQYAILGDGILAKYNDFMGFRKKLSYNSYERAKKWLKATKYLCKE